MMTDKQTDPSRFVKHSYEESDSWGISRVAKYLATKGWEVVEQEENYGVDIIAKRGDVVGRFEVEVKTNRPFTCKEDFPFSTVSFLARKQKWSDKGFWYVIVCRETEAFLICHSSVIYDQNHFESVPVSTRDRKGTDKFFRVPKDLCYWYSSFK